MNYNEIFREAFSDVSPVTDNESIVRNVKERSKKMENRKKSIRKVFAAVAAAAAVTAAATITVGAVTGWDFNAAFGRIFGGESTSATSGEESGITTVTTENITATFPEAEKDEDGFDFSAYGKELDLWYDMDGFRLNIKGISADRTTAYILYDVIFDEGIDCREKDGWTDWYYVVQMDALEAGETEAPLTRVNRSHCEIISQDGDTLSFYGMMSLSDTDDTLQNKTITLDFSELYRMLPTVSEKSPEPWLDRESYEGALHAEIPVDFDICTEAREFVLNQPIEFHKYNEEMEIVSVPATVTEVSVTPFSWQAFVELDTSEFTKGDGYSVEVVFRFKDGTELKTCWDTAWHTESGTRYRAIFSQPTDPMDIESVTVIERL